RIGSGMAERGSRLRTQGPLLGTPAHWRTTPSINRQCCLADSISPTTLSATPGDGMAMVGNNLLRSARYHAPSTGWGTTANGSASFYSAVWQHRQRKVR